MSLTSHIRMSDATFKLAQKLVESLSERFGFSKDDAWNHVSSMSVEVISRKMRKERRKQNPTSQIKKPRTAFSFFTQRQRPLIQAQNPTAKFGDLSRFVSVEWKKLTETQLKEYKDDEAKDRVRYNEALAACKEQSYKVNVVDACTTEPTDKTSGEKIQQESFVPVVESKLVQETPVEVSTDKKVSPKKKVGKTRNVSTSKTQDITINLPSSTEPINLESVIATAVAAANSVMPTKNNTVKRQVKTKEKTLVI